MGIEALVEAHTCTLYTAIKNDNVNKLAQLLQSVNLFEQNSSKKPN